jgi:hypothetical protein
MVKKIIQKFISLVGHLGVVGLLLAAFQPLATWYYQMRPLMGTDFFLTKTYVSYLSRFFTLRPLGWKYIWYSGYPLGTDYPTLHFYLILPLLRFFSQVQAVQVYMLISLFLFGLFCYLLFFELSSSRLISAVLAVASWYSVGLYGSLLWGGGLPYFATQCLLPLVLCLIVRHYHRQNSPNHRDRRYLILAAFITGIAFLGHPQLPVATIVPAAYLLILLWNDASTKLISKVKLKDFFIFTSVYVLTGFSYINTFFVPLFNVLLNIVRTGQKVQDPVKASVLYLQWELDQLKNIVLDVTPVFWVAIAMAGIVFLISFLFRRKLVDRIWLIVPFGVSCGFVVLTLWLYAYRYNPFQGGWYRAFWTFPIWYGSFCAILWGAGRAFFSRKLFTSVIWSVGGFLCAAGLVAWGWTTPSAFFEKIGAKGNPSSAFPSIVNSTTTKEEEDRLKTRLLPSWLDPNDKNHRMFSIDAGMNIWWNSYFDLPLAQGYIDPYIPYEGRGYLYLRDITIAKDELVERFKHTKEEAANVAKYVLDWSAIKYFEGGFSDGRTTATAPISSYVADNLVDKEALVDFNNVQLYDIAVMPKTYICPVQKSHYYKFKDEYVGDNMTGTNASVLGVAGGFNSNDMLSRVLAVQDYNSKSIVNIIGPKMIDQWSYDDFLRFDSVFLYNYDYKNKSKTWGLIEAFLRNGGTVFIDTGGDVKETSTMKNLQYAGGELPEFFPVSRTDKGFFGKNWSLEKGNSPLVAMAPIDAFSDLQLDGEPWGLSYATKDNLREGARIILSNAGQIVMAESDYGKGKIIWSGLNLPYHLTYHQNSAERKFLLDLVGTLVDLREKPVPISVANWINPQLRKLVLPQGAKGALLKEYYFKGWKAYASAKGRRKRVPILTAGPAYPGYMYVPIPKEWQQAEVEIEFRFSGTVKYWLYEILPWIMGLIVVDSFIARGKLLRLIHNVYFKIIGKHVVGWWDKEE